MPTLVSTQVTDAIESWAGELGRVTGAELMVNAIGGTGVTDSAYNNIFPRMDNTLTFDPTYKWDSTKWTPDAVVLLIGPNDGGASTAAFSKAYSKMLNDRALAHAAAATKPKLINICGGSGNGWAPCDKIKAASDKFNADAAHPGFVSYYLSISRANWEKINPDDQVNRAYTESDDHYNMAGVNVLLGDILAPMLDIMGWAATPQPTACTDTPGWKDSDGDSCAMIVGNGYCPQAADYAVNGVDAKQACCGCKKAPAGATPTTPPQPTAPTACTDTPGWKDSDGDSCAMIVGNGHCPQAADYAVNGVDAKQACCGCKKAPAGATPTAPTACTDTPGWKDSDGDSCGMIASNGYCPHAADYAVNGVDAKQACCGCKTAPAGAGNANARFRTIASNAHPVDNANITKAWSEGSSKVPTIETAWSEGSSKAMTWSEGSSKANLNDPQQGDTDHGETDHLAIVRCFPSPPKITVRPVPCCTLFTNFFATPSLLAPRCLDRRPGFSWWSA